MASNHHQVSGEVVGTAQVDLLLPSQLFGSRHRQAPELRLMIAVFSEALDCLEKYRFAEDDHGRRTFDEAKLWFLADETAWPYSFECICAILDLDSRAVRQRLHLTSEARPRVVLAPPLVEASNHRRPAADDDSADDRGPISLPR